MRHAGVGPLRTLRRRRSRSRPLPAWTRGWISAILGLDTGDGHIIRNAGGIITDDVIRSLRLSQRALGTRIILLHHTKCGVCGVIEEEFRAELEAEYGVVPEWSSGGFSDPYDDVRRSIELLRDSPFAPHTDHVWGFVDVDTGLIDPVDSDSVEQRADGVCNRAGDQRQ